MRVNTKATKRMWQQTVWSAVLATVGFLALMIYFWTLPTPDYAAIRFLALMLVLTPLLLGVAYFIRRFIERLER